MKKLLIALILIATVFVLSACRNSELSDELKQFNTAQNYTVFTTVNVIDETFTSIVRKTENALQFQSDFEQFFMANLNNRYYVFYRDNFNLWIREEIDRSEYISDTNFVAPIDHLRASWFDYEDGIWVLRERHYNRFLRHAFFDGYDVDYINEFFIEISDAGLFWFLSYELDGTTIDMTAVFFDFGTTSITLPAN